MRLYIENPTYHYLAGRVPHFLITPCSSLTIGSAVLYVSSTPRRIHKRNLHSLSLWHTSMPIGIVMMCDVRAMSVDMRIFIYGRSFRLFAESQQRSSPFACFRRWVNPLFLPSQASFNKEEEEADIQQSSLLCGLSEVNWLDLIPMTLCLALDLPLKVRGRELSIGPSTTSSLLARTHSPFFEPSPKQLGTTFELWPCHPDALWVSNNQLTQWRHREQRFSGQWCLNPVVIQKTVIGQHGLSKWLLTHALSSDKESIFSPRMCSC